ncbi:DUF362 domain-containing protein [Blautia sp. Sow4_E7]|uniref:DUF362 domain-containing protein n=1 Tax=Blautia sp. Sow4_E7 TaxID=3438749 RepID=UPI003F91F48F
MNEKSKVIVLSCDSYEEERIYTLLKRGLKELGGVGALINKEEKILLKPNLLKKAEVEKAVITHPVVVGAFARILREEGYENIVLADSCGHGTTKQVIQGTGMDTYLEKYQIPAIDYTKGVHVENPDGVQAKEFILPKELLEADCVISLSKMKTHALERITGAVKNSYGFIYGKNKAIGHTKYPSADSFARMLIDLNQYVKPRLYILDGITAMEGNGPGSGDPTVMNVILMSTDPVALDSVFARLVYLKPEMVPTNYHGEKMGLGNCKESNIEVVVVKENSQISVERDDGNEEQKNNKITVAKKQCENADISADENQSDINISCNIIPMEALIEQYGNPHFNVDRTKVRSNIWTKLAKALNIFQKKPYIEPDKCIHCGICVNSCPVPGKAVDFRNGKNHPPVYDYKKCIRCFCCQEMCPKKAIKVK